MSDANNDVKVRMRLSRETKGTFVYEATKEDAVITTLYVKKDAYEDAPENILVIVKDRDSAG